MRYLLLLSFIALFVRPLPAAAQPTGCDQPAAPGESAHTLTYDGLERSYLLYVPASYDPAQPAPLVLSMHGFSSNPTQQVSFSQWNPLADEYGFIVAYPQGTGFPLRWNSGANPFAPRETTDDVGFIGVLIDTLSSSLCIDLTRVYATGLSNGGGMSNRLACELADRITAIGGVAGAYSALPECQPSRPVPVIAFHGTDDTIVPYEGTTGQRFGLPPIEDWAAEWAGRNGCDLAPQPLADIGAVSGVEYTGCEAPVTLYTVHGGGHTWPGGEDQIALFVGETNRDVNASAMMWDFFQQYAISPASG